MLVDAVLSTNHLLDVLVVSELGLKTHHSGAFVAITQDLTSSVVELNAVYSDFPAVLTSSTLATERNREHLVAEADADLLDVLGSRIGR